MISVLLTGVGIVRSMKERPLTLLRILTTLVKRTYVSAVLPTLSCLLCVFCEGISMTTTLPCQALHPLPAATIRLPRA